MLETPFVLHVDVSVKLPGQCLIQLYVQKNKQLLGCVCVFVFLLADEENKSEHKNNHLTSSSHCRCLSLRAMSSGVSPASLA